MCQEVGRIPIRSSTLSGRSDQLIECCGPQHLTFHLEERTCDTQLTPINTRPWLLNGLSLRLIESHYENHYGGAFRRLNAITEQLESLDFDNTPGYVVNSLKREELIAQPGHGAISSR